MTTWVSEKAFAKINLALHVLGRSENGYHQLDSVVAFADVCDEISLRAAKYTSLTVAGPFAHLVPADQDNILFKAHQVARDLAESYGAKIPPLEIHLEKNLPVAAGIGGGSADAAAFLRAVFRMMHIIISPEQTQSLASILGADVPVCLPQRSARMQGIGEIVSTLTIKLPAAIVLINPLTPCSTQTVFQNLGLRKGQNFRNAVNVECAPEWRNDLTEAAITIEPEIEKVLQSLQAEPCFSAVRMSGSGATCFGLVSSHAAASAAAARLSVRNPNWWVKAACLL